MDPPGTQCVLVTRLPSAVVRVSLEASFFFCKAEHGSLSYHIPLFPSHTGTEEQMHTLEPIKIKKLLIIYYFAGSIFTTANIHGAGRVLVFLN